MVADVAIIGAGIVGIATAHALLDDGRRVVLIERGEIARGASFGNAGALAFSDVLPLASPGIMRKAPRWLLDPLGPLSVPPAYALGIAPWLYRFWRASSAVAAQHSMAAQVALMRLARSETHRLIAATGLQHMLLSDGELELYESAAELEASLPNWDARAKEGIEFRHVAGEEIAALQPGLSPRFTHATFVPGWQSVSDPYEYACALADKARQRGAEVSQGEVAAIEPIEGGVSLRLASGSTVRARQAVVACGAWSKALAAQLGDPVPLDTERGYNTTLPPGSFDLKRQLTFGGHGFVVTRLSSGIRVGGAVELGGLKLKPNFRRSEAMLAKAKAFLPDLKTEGGRQWMGFRPSMPDSLPVIGPASATRDVVYAFGHGHLGLTQSAATGRLVADLLAGRPPAIDLGAFSPTRF
ncbi:NAD(P)/FAD-dependent oxidoreductase [Mangrovicella endophytica]|uniref:NAD(P)/FAD-dependent oxidoreductase n=1 Tax=Mangrovicella endophytica TaxID=2066697 RepID=UPI000C9DB7DF|nr:FAD-binding oxidoreductase [Mangrovicella endophytica]